MQATNGTRKTRRPPLRKARTKARASARRSPKNPRPPPRVATTRTATRSAPAERAEVCRAPRARVGASRATGAARARPNPNESTARARERSEGVGRDRRPSGESGRDRALGRGRTTGRVADHGPRRDPGTIRGPIGRGLDRATRTAVADLDGLAVAADDADRVPIVAAGVRGLAGTEHVQPRTPRTQVVCNFCLFLSLIICPKLRTFVGNLARNSVSETVSFSAAPEE